MPVRRSLSQAGMLHAPPKPADLDRVHWIGDRDEACVPVEGVKRCGAGLEPVGMPGKSVPYAELDKAPLPVAQAMVKSTRKWLIEINVRQRYLLVATGQWF